MNQATHTTRLRLLRTEPHSCSYLDNQIAVTEFVAPEERIDPSLYQGINELGFRRSGNHYYRPNCPECARCKPLRVLVDDFEPNRSQQRTLKRNTDMHWTLCPQADQDRYFPLYQRYIESRHADGDMHPATTEQFHNFIERGSLTTQYIEFSTDKLQMVAVCDFLPDGLSAIYSFFDPEQTARSLGTLAILIQIQMARQLDMPYVYLGYWIEESAKMRYKTNFSPCEVLYEGRWQNPPF